MVVSRLQIRQGRFLIGPPTDSERTKCPATPLGHNREVVRNGLLGQREQLERRSRIAHINSRLGLMARSAQHLNIVRRIGAALGQRSDVVDIDSARQAASRAIRAVGPTLTLNAQAKHRSGVLASSDHTGSPIGADARQADHLPVSYVLPAMDSNHDFRGQSPACCQLHQQGIGAATGIEPVPRCAPFGGRTCQQP